MKIINQIVAFTLELIMLGALGFTGFHLAEGSFAQYALALLFPGIAIVLWGYFAAPRSSHRLAFPWLTIFKLILFSISFFLLYQIGYPTQAAIFWSVALVNVVLEYIFER